MSPTSLKLTLAQLQRGSQLDLAGCLLMEYRLSQRCMAAPDFREGIRALLVDKDNSPRWSPASVAEVSDEIIASYFDPIEFDLELPEL